MSIQQLHNRIIDQTAVIGVVGLGYVGFPTACMFAKAGFQVIGVDIKPELIEKVNRGESPIGGDEPGLEELVQEVVTAGNLKATTKYEELSQADVVLIVVETPVNKEDHIPHYEALRSACNGLGKVIKKDTLLIVESTVAPGTTQQVVQPIIEQLTGMHANDDFFLGACPERVMPGKLLANMKNVSRVCGGGTPEIAQAMVALYRNIVAAELDEADILTAELVKTTENAYRDVNIAFANEVALICEASGGNVWRVRELVNKSPGRNMLFPGAGVGGHCIPKDPWLLLTAAGDKTHTVLIPAGREVNDGMPGHVADLLVQALSEYGRPTDEAVVAVLGYSYLEDSDDTRNSPSALLISRLEELGINYVVHDPWVEAYTGDLLERVRGCDAVVLMVKHSAYQDLDLQSLKTAMRTPIIIDGRGFFDPASASSTGFLYYAIGRGDLRK